MPSNSIINRIKTALKKEKQKKKDHRKRKLCFEQLENKEMLATTVSIDGLYYLEEGSARYEGSNILPGGCGGCCCGGSGCCCSGCCCSGCCCGSGCCTSGCFPSPGYMIGGCIATPNKSFSGSYQHIPVTVVPDPNNPYWLPKCFSINFEIVPDSNISISWGLQVYVRYVENGVQKSEQVKYNNTNPKLFSFDYRPGMANIKLEVTSGANNSTPNYDKYLQINLLPGNCHTGWVGTNGGCQQVSMLLYETNSSLSQATVVIQNDDHWKVGVTTFKDVATGRLSDVEQDYAYYKFTKSGGTDWQYAIDVQFTTEEWVYPNDPLNTNATYIVDYNFGINKFDKLTNSARYNQELAVLGVTADEYERGVFLTNFDYQLNKTTTDTFSDGSKLITRYFAVTIPAGTLEDEYYGRLRNVFYLRVEPVFNWNDKGQPFDPTTPGTLRR